MHQGAISLGMLYDYNHVHYMTLYDVVHIHMHVHVCVHWDILVIDPFTLCFTGSM